jgi:hypothetical protein
MIKTQQFGTAKIIYKEQEEDILSLAEQEVVELFKSCGCLLFRDFAVNHEQMISFSKKFSSGYVRDPQKINIGSPENFVQLVDNGTDDILPHCENAVSPFRPDVIWFCCGVPAAKDGETLFWDGVKVWEELQAETRQLFAAKKLKFSFDFDVDSWQLFFGPDSTIEDAKKALDKFEGTTYFVRDDQSIHLEYTCPAVVRTITDGKDAFANSILPFYKQLSAWDKLKYFLWNSCQKYFNINDKILPEFILNYLKPSLQIVSFEDGLPIPNVIIAEINGVMNRLTGVIKWQPGDLVMMDNSKFLHGRRAFTDTRRQVFSHLSYLKV